MANPPPSVALTGPTNGSTYTASASVTLSANAAAPYNSLSQVAFYTNGIIVASVSTPPYSATITGLAAGSYTITAAATDGSGLTDTSAPVTITVNPGSGQPYGLTNVVSAPAFYNMPPVFTGPLPAQLIVDRRLRQHAGHGPGRQPDSLRAQRAVVVRRRAEGALLFRPQHRRAFHVRPTNCLRADHHLVFPGGHGFRQDL